MIFGQVLQAGQGQIPSRQAQIKAEIPREVPSETINKVCASGMRTIGLADQAIRAGDLEIGMTGGMESMSNAPYLLPGARFGFRMGDKPTVDAMTHDGLTNPFTHKQMINEASESRTSSRSRGRTWTGGPPARTSSRPGRPTRNGLAEEIVSVTVKTRKAENVVEADEAIRPDSTVGTLAKLPAVGGGDATHTAGNSPGVNDGAAAVVVASDEWAEANGREPLATVLAYGTVADASHTSPGRRRAQQALDKLGRSADEIDLWEINEAFASVALNSLRMGLRGQRQRQRRGDRSRAPDRRLRRAHRRGARSRASPSGGGVGCAAICSGGGQGRRDPSSK